jgi:hypothetical protein
VEFKLSNLLYAILYLLGDNPPPSISPGSDFRMERIFSFITPDMDSKQDDAFPERSHELAGISKHEI